MPVAVEESDVTISVFVSNLLNFASGKSGQKGRIARAICIHACFALSIIEMLSLRMSSSSILEL